MNVTRNVWLELTKEERLVVLRFAVSENQRKWKKTAVGAAV